MPKLRHIAIVVPDTEVAARFFERAFDLKRVGTGRRALFMTDGIVSLSLLRKEYDDEPVGLAHFGMWVDDLDEADKKVIAAGGKYLSGKPTSPKSFYEAKYQDPMGNVFDLTHSGWAGAIKEVEPAK